MIFISYYTTGVYEKVINIYLLPSLKKWNLKYNIKEIKDKGSWQLNTGYKSQFIKEMLLKYREDICFIDADATIELYPKLLFNIPNKYDIAIHFLDWYKFWRNIRGNTHRELLSGTMVIKYKENTIKLLDEWIQQVKIQKTIKEQKVLEKIVSDNPKYKIYDLPVSYCAIKKFDGSVPEYVGKPVVLHHQASRQFKNRRK
jgi:hypothetical protein